MRYCARCTFPENARPTIIFDEEGVCSGCRVAESKKVINWEERESWLRDLLEEYKARACKEGNPYDCIIPVSGGKDSHYQVYLAKEVYGMNPLLVTYNHCFNLPLGVRNLRNLVRRFDCDLLRVTSGLGRAKKLSRYMLEKCGDVTWHYHCGIFTTPFQIAVEKNIPLILWGDHARAELTGQFRLEDLPEFTKWCRQQYDMRGIEIEDIINDPKSGLTQQDMAPFIFPNDEEMDKIGVRGIYMGTYVEWDALKITRLLVEKYDFKMAQGKRDKTFNLYHKIDDHANGVHDYLKYLKFGYGRATDHTAEEIRNGRMTREEGIALVKEYDSVRPEALDIYLDLLGITEKEFENLVDDKRDAEIWEKDSAGKWSAKCSIVTEKNADNNLINAARLKLVEEDSRTFGKDNKSYYYSKSFEPFPHINDAFVIDDDDAFITL